MENYIPWTRGKLIGKGSCGTVSLAKNKSSSHAFAVKSVEISSCNISQLQSLENEIRILSRLSSPYIVKYRGDDVSWESSSSYRNMHIEYMPGGTAASFVCTEENFGMIRSTTRCIVESLAYLHSKRIVHCDVKGKNVLLGGIPGMAKLADFGSATQLAEENRDAWKMTLPRGTPAWMAPEVIRGESQGIESDVWSLGCTVIEMVTGKPPWKELGVNGVFRIGFSDELPVIPSHFPDLGRDFVEKCLRRSPSDRWTCNRLMLHPFLDLCLLDSSKNQSPRSVLDWSSTDFEYNDVEASPFSCCWAECDEMEELTISARSRIRDLDERCRPNWGSVGWEIVRCRRR